MSRYFNSEGMTEAFNRTPGHTDYEESCCAVSEAFAALMAAANKEIESRDERIADLEHEVEELKARIEEMEAKV